MMLWNCHELNHHLFHKFQLNSYIENLLYIDVIFKISANKGNADIQVFQEYLTSRPGVVRGWCTQTVITNSLIR